VLLGSGVAAADEAERIAFRVEYSEGSTCSNAESFAEQLLRRTERLRPANADERSLTFRIAIAPNGATLNGRLSVRELDGSETTRDVPGATCEDVTTAMALIAAVLVDPNASTESAAEPATEPSPPPLLPETAAAAAPAQARKPEPAPPARAVEPNATPSRVLLGGGAMFALEGAVGPEPTPALSLELEAALERNDFLSPLFVLAFEYAFPTRAETPNGVARLQWMAGRATGCPLRFPASGRLALRPCALFEYGRLAASGEETQRRASTSTPWTALGGTLRGEYTVVGALLVVLEGGFVAPLQRDTFYFDPPSPENVAFEVPSVGATARLGIAARLD
jgi:hypothetical protein